jgi:hypothetical protein
MLGGCAVQDNPLLQVVMSGREAGHMRESIIG